MLSSPYDDKWTVSSFVHFEDKNERTNSPKVHGPPAIFLHKSHKYMLWPVFSCFLFLVKSWEQVNMLSHFNKRKEWFNQKYNLCIILFFFLFFLNIELFVFHLKKKKISSIIFFFFFLPSGVENWYEYSISTCRWEIEDQTVPS